MRFESNRRALALAGKPSNRSRSFTSGLLLGLSGASLMLASILPRPQIPKEGVASDWKAIGGDLRNARRKHVQ
jgi:hypothetical protein